MTGQNSAAHLSLVFAKGSRPDADCLFDLAGRSGKSAAVSGLGFAVSHCPARDKSWIELLAMGLTFECHGLSPADPIPLPSVGQLLGLSEPVTGEAIELVPGPHLGEGLALMPVIRVMCGLGAVLSGLPGVQAVCWGPARSWMAPDYFVRATESWLTGGAFPALGLATLDRDRSGALTSIGLDYLIGQELRFEPDSTLTSAAATRIAVRLIHQMAEGGAITSACDLVGIDGETLLATPAKGGRQLQVARRR